MSFRMDHSCVREEEEDSVLHQGMLYLLEMDLHFFSVTKIYQMRPIFLWTSSVALPMGQSKKIGVK